MPEPGIETNWEIFKRREAVIRDDHFVYAKGHHGSEYVNKDAIIPFTADMSSLCERLAKVFVDLDVEIVVGPAVAGAIVSQWVAHHISIATGRIIPGIYTDKVGKDAAGNDIFALKRGYDAMIRGKRALIVEDVLNTGGSAAQTVQLALENDAVVLAVGALCNRGNVKASEIGDVPFLFSLTEVSMEKHLPDDCPFCKEGRPINTKIGHGADYVTKNGQPRVSV